jgi:antitoxin component YwqK of YwqJK toxin-antitoxin module
MNPNDPVTIKNTNPISVKPILRHIIKYYFNTNVKFCEYNLNENNQWHGLYEVWHFNGQLMIRCNCQNGCCHGLYEEWYDDGSLHSRHFYNNGKIES